MRDAQVVAGAQQATGPDQQPTARPTARRRRGDRQSVVALEAVEEPVRRVWEAYAEAVGDRVILTQAREDLIRARLSGWTADELVAAVKGYGGSEWHFGANDRGRRYVDLELWFRDASHIESGRRMAEDRGRKGQRKQAVPAPINGIEAKWDEWFKHNPEGEYRFPPAKGAVDEH
jgi:hypothetical protein